MNFHAYQFIHSFTIKFSYIQHKYFSRFLPTTVSHMITLHLSIAMLLPKMGLQRDLSKNPSNSLLTHVLNAKLLKKDLALIILILNHSLSYTVSSTKQYGSLCRYVQTYKLLATHKRQREYQNRRRPTQYSAGMVFCRLNVHQPLESKDSLSIRQRLLPKRSFSHWTFEQYLHL